MASMLTDYYCERIGKIYVIGPSTLWLIGFNLCKPFLSRKTKENMKLIYKLPELEQYFEKENIY